MVKVEFTATLIFVFAGVGSAIAYALTATITHEQRAREVKELARRFFRSMRQHYPLHWHFLLDRPVPLCSIVACLLLKCVIGSTSVPTHEVASGVSEVGEFVMGIVITFMLVYIVYTTAADPKKGSIETITLIVIGFIVGANILTTGPFNGGTMNPTRSFETTLVSRNYSEIWIYWADPLIGGSLARLVYGDIFIRSYAPLTNQASINE